MERLSIPNFRPDAMLNPVRSWGWFVNILNIDAAGQQSVLGKRQRYCIGEIWLK